ncbi:MAG: DNA polymerase III, subunit gamma and tau [Candidatus Blackburnbacteria bacterium RIFCSPHIGHO2_01_FULL_43_15b]|uniref:DNA polymerase III subunit gamma/tau n=1 Tax=Candidatus Blackburnbacteria bacterium RIFCSPHIGHO2_01_FULL_43_15b TaxID=1797513 RepID=A0A1G1UYL1_9BACT|nr:MAG: DNA polymerase III, subunit gamma and tau [Candidatus Blackburnbacteria bacterium RIFCSPHIGHO2_01_FULL_43_15b]
MTFYLKYRPQKIAELDLQKVRENLARILGSGNTPHAFLFSGPRGAGKTSAARIVAKAINCEHNNPSPITRHPSPIGDPCNECATCVAITNGSSLDVIEIDAASNRGVDDIRSLREGVKLATAGAKKKVYIIDEAHMLTNEASNALLKTLEEPPSHVVFILATTAPGKLLDTIRSRCTNIIFPKATDQEVVESLNKVVKGEKLKVEDGVLEDIAGHTDGSFREAHKILEQLSVGREKVGKDDTASLFSISTGFVDMLLNYLSAGDTKSALEEIGKVSAIGVDLKTYTSQLVGVLRQILLSEFAVASPGRTLQGWEGKVGAKDLGGVERVRQAIELFSEAFRQLPSAVIPTLPLELAIVKWSQSRAGSQPIHLLGNSASAEGKEEKGALPIHSSDNSDPASGGTGSRGFRAVKSGDSIPLEPTLDKSELHSSTTPPLSGKRVGTKEEEKQGNKIASQQVDDKELEEKWKLVMKEVKPKNHSIEALLRATKPSSFDGKILMLEVFYQFHKDKIEKDPYRTLVEEAATQVLGAPVKLACFLAQQKRRAADISNIAETIEEDIVRAAEDIFGVKSEEQLPN